MNQTTEQKYRKALDICQSLIDFKYRPTDLTYQAIELFCEIGEDPFELLRLSQKYSLEIDHICNIIDEYGTSLDNWLIDCPLGFGIKDNCTFLSFFLNIERQKFTYFTGNFTPPEQIVELLNDWRGIDLTPLLEISLIPQKKSR